MTNITEPLSNASLAEILSVVRAGSPALNCEQIPLGNATGRVLRENVLASEDQPAFDRSAVDGYAVNLDDGSTRFRVVDFLRAGEWRPRNIGYGEAVRIATGGALPARNLQVVMQEDVQIEDDFCVVLRRTKDRNIRMRGEDAHQGDKLVPEGTPINPGVAALLASLGHVHPLVTRLPRVLHFATGDEIVSPEIKPQPGQIRDSNSPLVRAFFQARGVAAEQHRLPEAHGRATEELARCQEQIDAADLLLFSGGASVGKHDYTSQLLSQLGFTLRVGRTNLRPGRPLIVATRGQSIAFGLPGNPLAHFVGLHVLVRAALVAFSGKTEPLASNNGKLVSSMEAGGSSRETLWPARMQPAGGLAEINLLPWHSSGDLTALATTNAIARIPAGASTLQAGSEIEFYPTDSLP